MSNFRGIPTALLSEMMKSAGQHVSLLLQEKMRLSNEIAKTRALLVDLNSEIQRRAEVAQRNRQRLGLPLPPMITNPDPTPNTPTTPPANIAAIPVHEEAREDGWVELPVEPVRRCFQCQFWKNRPRINSSLGYCNRLSTSCAANSMTCGHFIPTSPTPPTLATDALATPDTMEACDGRR